MDVPIQPAGSTAKHPQSTCNARIDGPNPLEAQPSSLELDKMSTAMDEDRAEEVEEADIEALLAPVESPRASPLAAPSELPPTYPHDHSYVKRGAVPSTAQSDGSPNSITSQVSGLPLDIATILDMVTISGPPQRPPPPNARPSIEAKSHASPSASAIAPASNSNPTITNEAESKSSDSSSSDWDSSASSSSDSEDDSRPSGRPVSNKSDDEEEDNGKTTASPLKTTNEVVDPDVAPPSVERVGDDEALEPVGEIMSVIGSVVVVKGLIESAAEKVLDTGSLLVWEDRNVVGEIFETFGPTHLPLYSICLPSSPPSSTHRPGRKVYHVPRRSNYVFTRPLTLIKGSDASNQHDEEIGEDELEFSDDEKELEWKRRKKNAKRGGSVVTPIVRDEGDWEYSSSAYYDHSAGGPSTPGRAAPAPYDEGFGLPYEDDNAMSMSSSFVPTAEAGPSRGRGGHQGGGSRGRGLRGLGGHSSRGGRDRGGGRGRGRGGRGGFRRGMPLLGPPPMASFGQSSEEYDPRTAASENFSFSTLPNSHLHQQGAFGWPTPSMAMVGMGMNMDGGPGGPMGVSAPHFNPNFFPGMMPGYGMGMGMGVGWGFGGGMMGGGGAGSGHWGSQHDGGRSFENADEGEGRDGT